MHPRRSSSARIPLLGTIAALFLALNLTGCAYIGAAIVLATAGGGGGGGKPTNQAPSVTFVGVTHPVTTQLFTTIDYDLIDPDGGTANLLVEWSTSPAGPFNLATELVGPPSEGVTGLESSMIGTGHLYVWDIFNDVFNNNLTLYQTTDYDVTLQFTPTDSKGAVGTPAQTQLGNQGPSVGIISAVATATDFFATIDYTLFDPNGDDVDIVAEFSVDAGTTFAPASEGPGSEGTSGLGAPVGGANHVYVWNFFADVPGVLTQSISAILRITPTDVKGLISSVPDSRIFLVGNSPPEVISLQLSAPPVGPADTTTFVDYSLIDDRGDFVDIAPQFSADGGLTFAPATPGPGGDGVLMLTASPTGIAHTFEWDFAADIPTLQTSRIMIQIRLTPIESNPPMFAGVSGLTSFEVGNTPPSVVVSAIPQDQLGPNVPVCYTLIDEESEPLNVTVEFSQNNAAPPWFPATGGTGGTGCGGAVPCDLPVGRASLPSPGVQHCFQWEYGIDGLVAAKPVWLRFTATDTAGANSVTVVSNDFRIGNEPPIAILDSIDATFGVEIDFRLLDATSDNASITADFSTDDGTTWGVIVPANLIGSTAGLVTSTTGVPHSIGWNSLPDVGPVSTFVKVRIIPSDSFSTGMPATSAPFLVQNNQQPYAFIEFPKEEDVVSGQVQVDYRLADFNGDPVDIVVQVRAGGAPTFSPATLLSADEGTISGNTITGISSNPTGISHNFVWDTLADFGAADFNNAELLITPSDPSGTGTVAFQSPFRIDNNNEPTIVITTAPANPSSNDVLLRYSLFDDESDLVDIDVLYYFDSGATFGGFATEAATGSDGVASLAADPAGVSHDFVWDSQADIGPITVANILLRITPRDNPDLSLGQGLAVTTPTFTVENDPGIAPPNIAAITPPTGNVLQSTSVIITGTGFITGSVAEVGGVPLSPQSVVNPNTIVGTVLPEPTGTPGFADLTVTNINGSSTLTNGFRYTEAPTAIIDPGLTGSSQGGNVIVSYDLVDPESDISSIAVGFSTDSGVTFGPATSAAGGDGITGLATSPGGTPHIFLWNSVADGVGLTAPETAVQFRIVPSDVASGTAGISGDFEVDNSVGRFALVSNWYEGTVSVVDTVNLAEIDTDNDPGTTFPPTAPAGISRIPVGLNPYGIEVNKRGDRAVVGNYGADTISIIDLNTYLVINTVNAGNGPTDVAFDHDGSRIFVLNDLADTIAVFDAATGSEIDTDGNPATTDAGLMTGITRIKSISSAGFLQMANGGSILYAGMNHVIDTTTYADLGSAGLVSTNHFVPLTDGKHLYSGQLTGRLAVLRTDIRAEIDLDDDASTTGPGFPPTGINRIDVGPRSRFIGVHGTRAYVVDSTDYTVSIVDTTTHLEIDADNDPGTTFPASAPAGINRIPLVSFGDPYEIIINSIGSSGLVANFAIDTVTILEFGSNTPLGDVAVGDGPRRIALTRRGTTEPIPPAIHRAVPDFGRALDTITIVGTGFDLTPANNIVEFGGVGAVVMTASATSLTVEVPAGVTQGDDITVEVALDRSNAVRFTPVTGPFVYVASEGRDVLAVLDQGAGFKVVGAIPVGNGPWGVAVSPSGDRAYVANRFSSDMSVVDLATHTVVATVPVGPGPRSLDTSVDGSLIFVHNVGDFTLSVIDAVTLTEIDTDNNINTTDPGLVTGLTRIKSLFYSPKVTALPTGDRVMIGNTDIIDIATYTKLPQMPIFNNRGYAIGDDSEAMYYTSSSSNLTRFPFWFRREIDLDDNLSTTSTGAPTGITRASTGTTPVAIAVRGDRIWTVNSTNREIGVYDRPTFTELDTDADPLTTDAGAPPGVTRFPIPYDNAQDFLVNAGGTEGYLSHYNWGRLQVADLVNYNIVTEPVVGTAARHFDFGLPTTSEPLPPVIESLSGPVMREGTSFTISGSGFDPVLANNTVFVGGLLATVTAATTTTLDTSVPTGALTGDVTVTVGSLTSNPVHLHVSAGPFIYVTSWDPDGVVILDLAMPDLEPVGLIPTGANPVDLTIHPDGSTLYSANSGSSNVTVIDLVTHTAVTSIPVGSNPQGVAINGDGSKLLANCVNVITIYVIDTATNSVTNTVSHSGWGNPFPIQSGGSEAYIGGRQIFDVVAEQTLGLLDVPSFASADRLKILPGDRYGWMTDNSFDNISIIDLRQRKEIDIDNDASTTSGGAPVGSGITRFAAGDGCQNMAYAAGKMYITNTVDTDISVFDVATRTEIDTDNDFLTTDTGAPAGMTRVRPGGFTLNEIVASSTGATLYVSMSGSDVISIIQHDVPSDTYSATVQISVGDNPRQILIGKASAAEPIGPVVASISGGVVRIGDTLFITGSGFDPIIGNNIVLVNGIVATVVSASATMLEIIIPAGATSGDLTVEVLGIVSNGFFVNVSAGPFAYVACALGDLVSVIDLATMQVVDGIPVGNDPRGIKVLPDGSKAYVTNFTGDSISVIDLATHQVISTFATGNGPDSIAVHPDGTRVYVLLRNISQTAVIDTATDTEIDVDGNPLNGLTRITGTNWSHELVINQQGTEMIVGGYQRYDVDPLSGTLYQFLGNLDQGPSTPDRVAFLDGGVEMWRTDDSADNVAVYLMFLRKQLDIDRNSSTTSTGAPLTGFTRIPAGNSPREILAFGGTAVVANFLADTISVYDVATRTQLTSFAVGADGPWVLDGDPGTSLIVVGGFNNDVASIVDVSIPTAPVLLADITVGNQPYDVAMGKATAAEPLPPRIVRLTTRIGNTGDAIRITGTGFDPTPTSNTVLFNGTAATVSAASATSLDVTVPVGATTGNLTVEVGGLVSNGILVHVDAGPFVYVNSILPDGVVVIDRALQEAIDLIPTGLDPREMVIVADGSRLYTANEIDDSVTAIDLATHTVITTINLGALGRDRAVTITANADGTKVFVFNYNSSNVSVIDTDPLSGTYHTEIGLVTGIVSRGGLEAEAGGARAYAGSWEIIDLVSNSEIGLIDPAPSTTNDRLLILPGDRFAWRADNSADTIGVVNLKLRKEVDIDDDASTTSAGAPLGSGVTRITAGDGPQNMAVAGGRVYVSNTVDEDLSVIDIATMTEIDTDNDPATTDAGAPLGMTRIRSGGINPNGIAPDVANNKAYVAIFQTSGLVTVIDYDPIADTYAASAHITVGNSPESVLLGKASTSEPVGPIVADLGGGVVRIGNTLIITGSGFDPVIGNNIVFVNGMAATVTFASTTELRVTIPVGATTGDLTVEVSGITSNPTFLHISTGPFAYVPCRTADLVSVIDLATMQVVAGIPVGNEPRGIAILPDGSKAYVSNFLSDNISVIDLETHQVVNTFSMGDGPEAIAAHPDGTRVYVQLRQLNRTGVIDTATDTEVDTDFNSGTTDPGAPAGVTRIDDQGYTEQLAINQQGTEMLARSYRRIDVDPLSPTLYQILPNYFQAPSAQDRGVYLDGGVEYWRSDDNVDQVGVYLTFLLKQIDIDNNYSTTSNQAPQTGISRIIAGDGPKGIAQAAGNVFVANSNVDSLSVFDVATRSLLTTLPIGADFPDVVAADAASSLVLVVGQNNDVVSIVDVTIPSTPVLLVDLTVGDVPTDIAIGKPTAAEPLPPRIVRPSTRIGKIGDIITITGEGFDPVPVGNTVLFNGTAATVNSATATLLDVTVPAASTTGNLTVEVGGLVSNEVLFHVNAGPFLYVNSFFPDGVVVIDPVLQEAIDLLPTGANPLGMVIVPDGSRLYTANEIGDSVTAIDLDSHTVIATIATADRTNYIVTNGDGTRVFTQNRNPGSISVIDTDPLSPSYHTEINEVFTVFNWWGFVAESGGARAYTGTTETIDLTNEVEIVNIDLGGATNSSADRLVILPGDAFAWRSDNSTDNISLVNLRLRREVDIDNDGATTSAGAGAGVTRMAAGDGPQYMQIAGGRMYVSNLIGDNISVFDIAGMTELDTDNNPLTTDTGAPAGITRIVPGGLNPSEIAPDVPNDLAYVAMDSSDLVTVIDFDPIGDTYAKIANITVGDRPQVVLLGKAGGITSGGPVIVDLSAGLARVGDTIFIQGSGFDPIPGNNTVLVDGMVATVVSATSTMLEITIPGGVMSGLITVEVNFVVSNPTFISVGVGPFAYVACTSANLVAVVDLSLQEVVTGIPVGPSPTGIVVLPDGSKAYVTHNSSTSSDISIIDLNTHQVTNLALPRLTATRPEAIAVHPDGTEVYVALRNFSHVAVIDTATDTEIDTDNNALTTDAGAPAGVTRITGVNEYWEFDVNPEGTILLAGSWRQIDVEPTSAQLYQLMGTYETGGSTADRIEFIDGGAEAWRTDNSAANVALVKTFLRREIDIDIDVNTTSSAAPIGVSRPPAGSGPRGIVSFGGKVWVGNNTSDTVSVYDVATRTETTQIALGTQYPWELAIDDRGMFVIVSARDTDSVTLIDAATDTVLIDLTVGNSPREVAVGKATTAEPIPPRITSLDTNIGISGDVVDITGVGFDSTPTNNTVLFDATAAVVNSASATLLNVTVPVAATTGLVTVEVGGLVSNGAQFWVTGGPFAYVTDRNGGRNGLLVVGLDPGILETIRFVPTGINPQPRRVAIVPAGPNAGDIYVTNYNEDTLSIIDGVTHIEVANLAAGNGPEDVRITPDGTSAYVMSIFTAEVLKFDTATRTDTGVFIAIGGNTGDLAMDPTGMWLIADGDDVIDLTTDTITGTTGLAGETAIEPLGTFAYIVQTASENVAVVDLTVAPAFPEIAPRIFIGLNVGTNTPTEIVMDPINSRAYVIARSRNNVVFIDTTTHLEIDTDDNPLTTDPDAPTGFSRAFPGGITFEYIAVDSIPNVFVLAAGRDVLSIMDPMDPLLGLLPVQVSHITVGNSTYGVAVTP
ncbi:MAG: IPT/TIG domain-containing protein [Planctomycetota bacterium]|nr:IPT/TIG domain-containing protein [Planctomycetota bacterium]